MASLTLEQAAAAPLIRKQYRVRYREPDGTVCFESVNDTEGAELLLVRPDGSLFSHIIVGLCIPCASGDGCGLGSDCPGAKPSVHDARWDENCGKCERCLEQLLGGPAPAPGEDEAHRLKPDESAADVFREPPFPTVGVGPPPPVEEPEAALEPPPVVDAAEEAARELASQIWFSGPTPRTRLAPANDQALAYCVEMNWLRDMGDMVVRGAVDPRPPEPIISAREQRLRWGPGW